MKILFAGPSLAKDLPALHQRLDSMAIAGPAARGDIARAVLQGATAVGLVDGIFEDTLSVWHKEILFLVKESLD